MRAIIWLIGFVVESVKWMVTIAVVGLWLGFFGYVGWFAARAVFPDLISRVQGALGR